MPEVISDHFILPLETLSTFAPRAPLVGAIVRSVRRVDIGV